MMDLGIRKRRSRSGYHGHHCDLCFEAKGLDEEVSGYCRDCCQYLCQDCYVIHNKLRGTRGHTILKGDEMPKQAEPAKHRKLDFCRKHPDLIRDLLCFTHDEEICPVCGFKEHQKCIVRSYDELSTTELESFYENINQLKEKFGYVKDFIHRNINNLEAETKKIQEVAQCCHDRIVARAAYYLDETKKDIQAVSESQINHLTYRKFHMEGLISSLEEQVSGVKKLIGKPLNRKEILKVQAISKLASKYANEFEKFHKYLSYRRLNFTENKPVGKFIRTTYASLGKVNSESSNYGIDKSNVSVPDISFPVSSSKNTASIETSESKTHNITSEHLRVHTTSFKTSALTLACFGASQQQEISSVTDRESMITTVSTVSSTLRTSSTSRADRILIT